MMLPGIYFDCMRHPSHFQQWRIGDVTHLVYMICYSLSFYEIVTVLNGRNLISLK